MACLKECSKTDVMRCDAMPDAQLKGRSLLVTKDQLVNVGTMNIFK